MHELSIALSIIEGVEEEIARRDGAEVCAVHLKLGPLSGVMKEALLFSYEVACAGTPLEGSKLEIEEIPIILYCPQCRQEQPAASIQRLCCAVCDTPSADVRRGKELELFALELSDEHATAAG
ncbi:MAG: hydrogenase maturation nickel metallochaperone HypA [Bryobacteraceae bacterium]